MFLAGDMGMAEREQGLFGGEFGVAASPGWVAAEGARLVRVAFETGGDNVYDYGVPRELAAALRVGQRIRAPFGRGSGEQVGFCVGFPETSQVSRVKVIREVLDPEPLLDEDMMRLAQWMAGYYCCPLGAVLSAMVPAAVKRQVGMVRRTYVRLTDAGRERLGGLGVARLSGKGRAILEFLAGDVEGTEQAEYDLALLAGRLGCAKGPFRTLARDGLVELEVREELDHPARRLVGGAGAAGKGALVLTEGQREALTRLEGLIDEDAFNAALLLGVTGSGKTEVYMTCIEKVLARGKQALVLVPEIALTPQAEARFLGRFERVAVLHSGLSNRERHRQWRWIAEGGAEVVVGARSAVFAPLPRLGLIVVDEEHEPSYKQDKSPRYHGRDVAVKRAHLLGITVILGSATPSLETLNNCRRHEHYHLLSLPKRVLDLPLPKVAVVDMRREQSERKGQHLISRLLEGQLRRCLELGKQAIVLLNRRGHSSYVYCPSCNYVMTCPNCDVSMTHHRRHAGDGGRRRWVMCHYCLCTSDVPSVCPVCGKKIVLLSPGTQRAEDEFRRKLPDARIRRVDSDSMRPGEYDRLLGDFGAGEIDILLGTQMIGKGLDFPNVVLVGVLNADTALSLPDFRASERTFQLISQVAGRCGRATDDGRVVVQSFVPDEPAIRLACEHDYDRFAAYELKIREQCAMPPYCRLARIVMRDMKLEKLEAEGRRLREMIDGLNAGGEGGVRVRGPVPAAIATIEKYHRQEILLSSAEVRRMQGLLARVRAECLGKLKVEVMVDVDPLSLL